MCHSIRAPQHTFQGISERLAKKEIDEWIKAGIQGRQPQGALLHIEQSVFSSAVKDGPGLAQGVGNPCKVEGHKTNEEHGNDDKNSDIHSFLGSFAYTSCPYIGPIEFFCNETVTNNDN